MPKETHADWLTIWQAIAVLQQMTNLRLNYHMLLKRIRRAKRLPATVQEVGPRCRLSLRRGDLPLWAAWIKETS